MQARARLVTLTAVLALPTQLAFAFTAEQAEAGRASYTQVCAACHGADLRMLPTAPLAGARVHCEVAHPQHQRLARPAAHDDAAREPGSLGEDGYLGVMAYILQRNGNAPSDDRLLGGERRVDRSGRRRRRAGCGRGGAAPAGLARAKAPSRISCRSRDQVLRSPAPGDWPMIRRDYSASSFSPLSQITASNVSQLQLAWIWPMRDGGTNQPAPLVYRGTIYLNNPDGVVQAINARDGSLIWEYRVDAAIASRGIALYEDKVIFQSNGAPDRA